MSIITDKGNIIKTGRELGRGGEGTVFEVVGNSNEAAKIYNQPLTPERAEKLKLMANHKTEKLLTIAGWPIEVLFTANRKPCGFTMRRFQDLKDIHTLYTPKNRKNTFPQADWRFLIHIALNTARAFSVVHEEGCVIGDVNDKSVLVAANATVKLIDCDSFQIPAANKIYSCDVGVPNYTPPELQGRSLQGITRTVNHDAFGLAVMIFHLLFMGWHPFMGRYSGAGDMTLERAITENRFPYGANARAMQMQPPPATLSLSEASSAIQRLFERAFAREAAQKNSRPQAREWIDELQKLEAQLKQCTNHSSHYYYNGLSACPWCRIEAQTGMPLFLFTLQQGQQGGSINLAALWQQMNSLPPIPVLSQLPKDIPAAPSPSATAIAIGQARKKQFITLLGATTVAVITTFLLPAGFFYNLLLGILAFLMIKYGGRTPDTSQIISTHQTIQDQWRNLSDRWQAEHSNDRYLKALESLRRIYTDINQLPIEQQKGYQQLQNERQQAQLKSFLENFLIENAEIPHIGQARKYKLDSYNIRTAHDITWNTVIQVQGFGQTNTQRMMDWRKLIEKKFYFNPNQGIDPADIANLESKINSARLRLERSFMTGANEVKTYHNNAMLIRQSLQQQSLAISKQLAQAKADKKAIGA